MNNQEISKETMRHLFSELILSGELGVGNMAISGNFIKTDNVHYEVTDEEPDGGADSLHIIKGQILYVKKFLLMVRGKYERFELN